MSRCLIPDELRAASSPRAVCPSGQAVVPIQHPVLVWDIGVQSWHTEAESVLFTSVPHLQVLIDYFYFL